MALSPYTVVTLLGTSQAGSYSFSLHSLPAKEACHSHVTDGKVKSERDGGRNGGSGGGREREREIYPLKSSK